MEKSGRTRKGGVRNAVIKGDYRKSSGSCRLGYRYEGETGYEEMDGRSKTEEDEESRPAAGVLKSPRALTIVRLLRTLHLRCQALRAPL
jgi:hypothetical protein